MRVITIAIAAWALGAGPMTAQPPTRLFDRFKNLVGEWESAYPDGEVVVVSYELISGGKAVMERVIGREHGESGMVSIFTEDGDRIAVSHFCTAGNQPRFRSEPIRGDSIRFVLVPESLSSTTEGHIHQFEFRFGPGDRLETDWSWYEGGRPGHSLVRVQRRRNR